MTRLYKAVRPNGTDFRSGTVFWTPESDISEDGWIVRHPTSTTLTSSADSYLSVSTSPTDCTGMAWPCRLLEVAAVEGYEVTTPHHALPNKRVALAWRVVRELPAHEALGPQGAEVAALIERSTRITVREAVHMSAAWDAARAAAWDAARAAAWDAAWNADRYAALSAGAGATVDAARAAARATAGAAEWATAGRAARYATWRTVRAAAWDAVLATLVRDLITPDQHDILAGPWRSVIGEVAW